MAFRVVQSKQGRNVIIFANANSTIAPNDSSLSVNGEVIQGLTIRSIQYGTDANGSWTLARGANLVFGFGRLSGFQDFAGTGMPFTLDAGANVTVTLFGSANGGIMLDCAKLYNQANNAGGANTVY